MFQDTEFQKILRKGRVHWIFVVRKGLGDIWKGRGRACMECPKNCAILGKQSVRFTGELSGFLAVMPFGCETGPSHSLVNKQH